MIKTLLVYRVYDKPQSSVTHAVHRSLHWRLYVRKQLGRKRIISACLSDMFVGDNTRSLKICTVQRGSQASIETFHIEYRNIPYKEASGAWNYWQIFLQGKSMGVATALAGNLGTKQRWEPTSERGRRTPPRLTSYQLPDLFYYNNTVYRKQRIARVNIDSTINKHNGTFFKTHLAE